MSLENSIEKLTVAVEKLTVVLSAKEKEIILATPPEEMKIDGDPRLITDEGVELIKPETKKKKKAPAPPAPPKAEVKPIPAPPKAEVKPIPAPPKTESKPTPPPAPPVEEKISEADAVAIANRMKEVATKIGDAQPLWNILKKHGADAVSSLLAKDISSVSAMMEELHNG